MYAVFEYHVDNLGYEPLDIELKFRTVITEVIDKYYANKDVEE